MARTDRNLTGIYNSTPITLGSGDGSALSTDTAGNAKTAGYTCTYISTATTTTIKTGKGILKSVIVTGGTAGTIIIYDNTAASGAILASFDSTNALQNYDFNANFATGLTVITSAATKLSVISD